MMNDRYYVELKDNRRAWVEFKSHSDGQADYEVGLCFKNLPSCRVRWKLNQPPACPFANEAGLTEAEAIFMARTYCEYKHQEYLEWTIKKGFPVEQQLRGLHVG